MSGSGGEEKSGLICNPYINKDKFIVFQDSCLQVTDELSCREPSKVTLRCRSLHPALL
jgi:hypothetical protein